MTEDIYLDGEAGGRGDGITRATALGVGGGGDIEMAREDGGEEDDGDGAVGR